MSRNQNVFFCFGRLLKMECDRFDRNELVIKLIKRNIPEFYLEKQ